MKTKVEIKEELLSDLVNQVYLLNKALVKYEEVLKEIGNEARGLEYSFESGFHSWVYYKVEEALSDEDS